MEKVYLLQTHEWSATDGEGVLSMVDSVVYGTQEKALCTLFKIENDYIAEGWELDSETSLDEMDNGTLESYHLINHNGEYTLEMEISVLEKEIY